MRGDERKRLMCAPFQIKKQVMKPGKEITAVAESGIVRHAWAGFARSEILDWWQRKGGIMRRYETVPP